MQRSQVLHQGGQLLVRRPAVHALLAAAHFYFLLRVLLEGRSRSHLEALLVCLWLPDGADAKRLALCSKCKVTPVKSPHPPKRHTTSRGKA